MLLKDLVPCCIGLGQVGEQIFIYEQIPTSYHGYCVAYGPVDTMVERYGHMLVEKFWVDVHKSALHAYLDWPF